MSRFPGRSAAALLSAALTAVGLAAAPASSQTSASVPGQMAAPAPATAVLTGLAYDTFTRFPNDQDESLDDFDPSVPFSKGFDHAAQTYLPSYVNIDSKDATAALMSFRQYGIAAHHYVLGNKRRVDDLSTKLTLITDCSTGTITQLDNVQHLYTVIKRGGSNGSVAGARTAVGSSTGLGSGSGFTVDIKNTPLGTQSIGKTSTQAFSSTAHLTPDGASKPTRTVHLRAYIGQQPSPAVLCGQGASGLEGTPGAQAEFVHAFLVGIISKDPNYRVNRTGPRIPLGRLPVYAAIRIIPGPKGKPALTVLVQNGNVRTLTAADAGLFAVPPGYAPAPASRAGM